MGGACALSTKTSHSSRRCQGWLGCTSLKGDVIVDSRLVSYSLFENAVLYENVTFLIFSESSFYRATAMLSAVYAVVVFRVCVCLSHSGIV